MTRAPKQLPLIGITMGDPVGIGPEIIVKALSEKHLLSMCRPVVFGDRRILAREPGGSGLTIETLSERDLNNIRPKPGTIPLIPVSDLDPENSRYGNPDPESGKAMADYITKAVTAASSGRIDALVTAPINKASLRAAGYDFPGHTEMLAQLTNTQKVVMMLAGTRLRVVLVTIHCALKEVPGQISAEKIFTTIAITHDHLKKYFNIEKPRIAVAALNPHGGENGLFGSEETEHILPAIRQAENKNMNVQGPFPPDTLFYRAAKGAFDAVVCMYHDQGLIPLKMLHFEDGVNISLGLPIIRTSVDHGTAYDIAGRNKADPSSLIRAVQMAAEMVANRYPSRE